MDAFLGEIRPFGFNFAPYGWMQCNGQVLPIQQYSALFSLLGTYYGGNGSTNFALPNLNAAVINGVGQLAGGQNYLLGQTGGENAVIINHSQLPSHTHTLNGAISLKLTDVVTTPTTTSYLSNVDAVGGLPGRAYTASAPNGTMVNKGSVLPAGGNQPHENRMPFLTVNYCIALSGQFPQRP